MRAGILLSDTKFMNTCSFIMHFKKSSECSKAFVECTICFGELREVSSTSFQLAPLTHEASHNTKELKRACIELSTLWHFELLEPYMFWWY